MLNSRLPWLDRVYAWTAVRSWEDLIPLPPLASIDGSLTRAKIALLTSAGVHLTHQAPFDMENHDGDASFRLIPGDVAASELTITHDYYDHAAADRDVNCVFPIERLRELVESKEIRGVVTQNVSFMGHILGREKGRFVSEKIPEIVDVFRSCRADAVLTAPG